MVRLFSLAKVDACFVSNSAEHMHERFMQIVRIPLEERQTALLAKGYSGSLNSSQLLSIDCAGSQNITLSDSMQAHTNGKWHKGRKNYRHYEYVSN